MHPDLEKLIALQALDVEAHRLRDEIAAAPKRAAELDARSRSALAARAALKDELAKNETQRRRLESDTADLRVKLDRTRKKIDAATTAVQVTALEHEAAFTSAEINRLEDQELAGMERTETLEVQLPAAEEQVAQTALALERERERSRELVARDRAALAELDARRGILRTEIETSTTGEASLSRYDRIAKARGTAIAEALLGKCMACGMMVRPQLWQDLRDNGPDSPSHDTMTSCENCGRILYYDPARDAPQRKPVHGESIAASIVRSSI